MTETQADAGCGCESQETMVIACSLGAQDVPQRVSDWRSVVAEATARSSTTGGVRLAFAPSSPLASRIAGLAAAETQCCAFFRMTLTLASTELALDIECPPDARPILDELLAG